MLRDVTDEFAAFSKASGYAFFRRALVIKSGNWKYTNKRECFFPSKNGNEGGVGTRGKKKARRKNRVRRLLWWRKCVGVYESGKTQTNEMMIMIILPKNRHSTHKHRSTNFYIKGRVYHKRAGMEV